MKAAFSFNGLRKFHVSLPFQKTKDLWIITNKEYFTGNQVLKIFYHKGKSFIVFYPHWRGFSINVWMRRYAPLPVSQSLLLIQPHFIEFSSFKEKSRLFRSHGQHSYWNSCNEAFFLPGFNAPELYDSAVSERGISDRFSPANQTAFNTSWGSSNFKNSLIIFPLRIWKWRRRLRKKDKLEDLGVYSTRNEKFFRNYFQIYHVFHVELN